MPHGQREKILRALHLQTRLKRPITGISCGSGLVAKQVERGNADLILALNSGRYRQMGQGSLAGFLPFTNANDMVMEFGSRELVPSVKIPVIFGLNATDPTIQLEKIIYQIKQNGFSGVNNYPTIGLIDGQFREALEEEGLSFDKEVEAIRIANQMGLFTVAFIFDEHQARKMLKAGADMLCLHLGLTKGGLRGAKQIISLDAAVKLTQQIFSIKECKQTRVLKVVYGGPLHTPADVHYIYQNTSAQGYIGGSAFDRTPSERAIEESTRTFKTIGQNKQNTDLEKFIAKSMKQDHISFIKDYIETNYMDKIAFADLAAITRVSRSHLSALFHRETGYTFPEYLANFRIHKARKLISEQNMPLSCISQLVGYSDYAHFSRTFKTIIGVSPSEFARVRQKAPIKINFRALP